MLGRAVVSIASRPREIDCIALRMHGRLVGGFPFQKRNLSEAACQCRISGRRNQLGFSAYRIVLAEQIDLDVLHVSARDPHGRIACNRRARGKSVRYNVLDLAARDLNRDISRNGSRQTVVADRSVSAAVNTLDFSARNQHAHVNRHIVNQPPIGVVGRTCSKNLTPSAASDDYL